MVDFLWYTVKKNGKLYKVPGAKKKKISVSFPATLLRKVTFGENQKLFVFHELLCKKFNLLFTSLAYLFA